MKRIALFLAIAAAAIACTNEETVTPELKVTSETTDLVIPTEGGELTLAFNVNVDWTAEVKEAEAKEWCSLSPASGKPGDNTLKVIALENEGTENRTVTVVLRALEATQEIVVTQLQKDALVLTGKKEFEVAYQGQNLEFAVSHNSELKATADVPWITEVKAKAVEESKLTFAVAANTGEARTGKITFEAGSLKEVVTVKQAAWALEFTVTPAETAKTFEAEGGEYEVTVAANVEYTVTVPENDWLTVADAEGVYTFTAAANTTPATREVEVKIAPKDEKHAEAAVAIKMNQKGAGAILEVSDIADKWFSFAATSFEVTVNTNLEVEVSYGWDAEGVEPWITYTETAGVYTFALSENSGMNLRSAFVKITPKDEAYADMEKTISVFQNGHLLKTWGVDVRTVIERKGIAQVVNLEGGRVLSMALFNDKLIVCAGDGTELQVLNKATGAKEGTLSYDGVTPYYITNDDAGNLVICNRNLYDSSTYWWNADFKVWYVANGTETPVKLIEGAKYGPVGSTIDVRGDVTANAVVAAPYEGIPSFSYSNEVEVWTVTDGVVGESVRVGPTGFVGYDSNAPGYWNLASDNLPGFALLGTSLNEGALLCVYPENILYKVNADATCTKVVDAALPNADAWNYAPNKIEVKSVNGTTYVAIAMDIYNPQWSGTAVVMVYDLATMQPVVVPNVSSYAYDVVDDTKQYLNGVATSADVLIEGVDGGINVYYIANNASAIEAFNYMF